MCIYKCVFLSFGIIIMRLIHVVYINTLLLFSLYRCATICLFIYLLMCICIASQFDLFQIKLLWTFMDNSVQVSCGRVLLVLLGKYKGLE